MSGPRICGCGAPENDHPYRHPFVPAMNQERTAATDIAGIKIFYDDQLEPGVVKWNGDINDGLTVKDQQQAAALVRLVNTVQGNGPRW